MNFFSHISYAKATGISLAFHGILVICLLILGPFATVDKPAEIAAVEVDIVPAGIVDRGEVASISAGTSTQTQTQAVNPVAGSVQSVSRNELLPPAMPEETNETSVVKEVSRGTAGADAGAAANAAGIGKVESTLVAAGEGSGSDDGAGVQTAASCQYSPKPTYPRAAKKAGWEGAVLVRVLIDTDGLVATASVRESSGYDILDEAAVKSVKKWRFSPAQKDGAAITSFYDIRVRFRLVDA